MANSIKISDTRFETGITVTSEEGYVFEAVVVHIPGTENTTFYMGTYDPQNAE